MWARGTARRVAGRLQGLDLRFPDAAAEARFKAHLERQVLWAVVPCMLLVSAAVIGTVARYYPAEATRGEPPFRWDTGDPRTVFFAAHLYHVLQAFAVAGLAVMRLRSGHAWGPSGEALALFAVSSLVATLFLMSGWHTAAFCGVDPEAAWSHETLDGEFITLFEMLVMVSTWASYVPIRSCLLWIVPACAVCTYAVVLLTVGSPFPEKATNLLVLLGIMCCFTCQGAYRHEETVRERWLAELKVQDQAARLETCAAVTQAAQQVGGTLSDIVVQLSEELRVVDSSQMHRSYFGRDMEGRPFTDILIEGDAGRFLSLVQMASQTKIMQSMPAVLDLAFGQVPTQLVMVDTTCAQPRYLVAVQTGDEASTVLARRSRPCRDLEATAMRAAWTLGSESASVGESLDNGGPVSVEFDALSPVLAIINATPGWLKFCEDSGASSVSESLAEQLEPRMLADFRIFLRQLVGGAVRGTWDSQCCTSVYREVEGRGPDGSLYKAAWEVTVPNPSLAFDADAGRYPVTLSFDHVRRRLVPQQPMAAGPLLPVEEMEAQLWGSN